MLTFTVGGARFNCRVAGACVHEGHVLLNRTVREDFWYLPGGRAELMEPLTDSLRREMQEEIGQVVTVERLLWVAESFFEHNGVRWHELGLYYLFSLPEDSSILEKDVSHKGYEPSVELEYRWFPLDGLSGLRLFPPFLREGLRSLPDHPVHILDEDAER